MIPNISIIVPVYNVERYIHSCLDSIIAQSFTNWECILVDDGSEDQSGVICDKYAQKDSRFIVIHKQNEGVAKARITAFEKSKGDLVTFIDSDDYVSFDYLEKLSKPILENGADMVSCNLFEVRGELIKESPDRGGNWFEGENMKDFISNHYFYDVNLKMEGMTRFLWSKMIRREYVKEGLMNGKGLWFGEDQIAVFTILYNIKKLYLIPDRLYYYVRHESQATNKYDISLWKSIISMLEKYSFIDSESLATQAIRIRSWEYIHDTIYGKMAKSNLSKKEFSEHLSYVRNQSYVDAFFKPLYINKSIKDNLRYWILKLKIFDIFYWDFKRSILKQKLLVK